MLGRHPAGRRRRSAVRPRRRARAAGRRGSRPRLSAARALSRAAASAGAAVARRPLRGDEEARTRDQGLRAGAVDFAAAAQRRRSSCAINLDTLERTDEAKAQPGEADRRQCPDDLEAIMALGNVLRGRKQFAECADVYSKGIATIAKPEKPNWVIFYFRGICYERSKQWPQGRGRPQEVARAVSRPAARAELSRLFLGRSGRQSRRRHAHDPARGRAARR